MIRGALVLAVGIALGAGGLIAARHDDKHGPVKLLAARDIAEKIDGKEARATAVEVTLEPGQAGAAHRHPGPAFGYVLEGEYEWAIDDSRPRFSRRGRRSTSRPGACTASRRSRAR